jgi:hypothetical protein
MPITNINIEMANFGNESWLLFLEEKINKFMKRYEMKKAYLNYKKCCEEKCHNAFGNNTFELRLGSVVNKFSTTRSKLHFRYYLSKDSFKNAYMESGVEIDLDDIIYDH